jgi:glycosyltransferase involved in cell wall biosynthesis
MRGLIVIPAYNEAAVIEGTLDTLLKCEGEWDVLVIDDGSRDGTANLAKAKGVRVLSLIFNLGIGTAVQTGYKAACEGDYDWCLQFDADGQHRADEIPKMIEALNENACVVGSRYLQEGFENTFSRRLGARYFSAMLKMLGCKNVSDPSSGFRLCDRRAIALFAKNYPLDYPEVEARLMLNRRQLSVVEIPVTMEARQGGVSSINSLGAFYYLLKVSLSLVLKAGR